MEARPRELRIYFTDVGRSPFEEWLNSLRDLKTRAKIETRLARARLGNLGDYCSVGDGVFELKIDYGAGLRVYFGQAGSLTLLLLCGGDKSTQTQDIYRAKGYWADYERREAANQ